MAVRLNPKVAMFARAAAVRAGAAIPALGYMPQGASFNLAADAGTGGGDLPPLDVSDTSAPPSTLDAKAGFALPDLKLDLSFAKDLVPYPVPRPIIPGTLPSVDTAYAQRGGDKLFGVVPWTAVWLGLGVVGFIAVVKVLKHS